MNDSVHSNHQFIINSNRSFEGDQRNKTLPLSMMETIQNNILILIYISNILLIRGTSVPLIICTFLVGLEQ